MLSTFAQVYEYNNTTTVNDDGLLAISGMTLVVALVVLVIVVAGMWKAFEKAKKPGWAAIIPIYNMVVLLQIAGRPVWWILLYLVGFVPFVGWIVTLAVSIIVYNDVAKSFGKGVGTTLLLLLLPIVGWPYLGFGDAKYKGPAGPVKK